MLGSALSQHHQTVVTQCDPSPVSVPTVGKVPVTVGGCRTRSYVVCVACVCVCVLPVQVLPWLVGLRGLGSWLRAANEGFDLSDRMY